MFIFRYKAACFACSLEQDLNILPNGDETEVKTIMSNVLFIGVYTIVACTLSQAMSFYGWFLFLDWWTRHKPEWRAETENKFSKSTLLWRGEDIFFRTFLLQCILVFFVMYYLLRTVSVFHVLFVFLGHLSVGWPVKRSWRSCWPTHF